MFKKISQPFGYKFNINQTGLYSISISASCKSGGMLGLFGGEDLRAEIDGIKLREIPAKNKPQYKDIPPAWNGSQLKGLPKTVIFVLRLKQGDHIIKFIPYRGAIIEKEPEIKLIQNSDNIEFNAIEQAQDGDCRPWITLALIDLPLKRLDASVKCEKRFLDSDDVKLIIDGSTQKNQQSGLRKNWYWQGGRLHGDTEEARFYAGLSAGVHYVELWADRMPVLNWVKLNLGTTINTNNKNVVQIYSHEGINGNEDYNRFDKEIKEAVDYWNDIFAKQEYPPQEILDYNLVKAIIYKESRVGYFSGGEIDVMQVGNPGDPALRTLNGELEEWELINGKLERLDYGGEASVKTSRDSIYWGVRWLYHKAQRFTKNKKRYWLNWKEAVDGYGPGNDEYTDDVWRIYKQGTDPDGIVLWKIDNKSGFSLMKILVAFGVILIAGLAAWRVCVNKYAVDEKQQTISAFSLEEKDEIIKDVFLKDLENYKKSTNNNYFADTLWECRKLNCVNQSIFYENYKLLVKNMNSNRHFINAVNSLSITDTLHSRDIDNDGENEIIFFVYDPLNKNFVSLAVIDKIGNEFKITEERINHGHGGRISVMDLTGDLIPEIAFFVSFGKGGEALYVYQYENSEIKEIFYNNNFSYAEYTFSDIDSDKKIEIKIEGEERDGTGKQGKMIYEYNEQQKKFTVQPELL